MKTINYSFYDRLIRTILILTFVFFLPFQQKVSTVCIALMVVYSIFFNWRNAKDISLKKMRNYPQFLLTLLFFIYVLGLIFSENLDFGLKDIEAKLSFFLLPLLFFVFRIQEKVNFRYIFLGFILGCLVSTILTIQNGLNCYNEHLWDECWTGTYFAYKLHINYLSFYYFIAILMVWKVTERLKQSFRLIIQIIAFLWFSFFIYKFFSIGLILASSISILFIYFYIGFKLKGLLRKIFISFGIILIAVSFLFIVSPVKAEIENYKNKFSTKSELYQYANQTSESISVRLVVWDVSLDIIKNNPLGVGTGDIKDKLIKKYGENQLDNFENKKYNPHNQYFQTSISIGWIGAFVLFLLLIKLFIKGLKNNNWILSTFIIIAFINMLFESFLEVQAGIVFFSFMICVLDSDNE